ncbi:AlkA protein [Glutamicibacter sp. JL.03c]|uniref:DNA-3-methyladenine glycosylase family protein n=1 Tax=Glutamicibacter sp. JL.03c TaxID=2984842 RepID=UPI0021F78505|nr:AlkA protein [Glutamicibacter sp. JL.03c]UYQ78154.1 AlkA protein [Glutamicibacter sp. JL.03c]
MRLRLEAEGTLDIAHALSVLSLHSLPGQEIINFGRGEVHRILRIEDHLIDARLTLDPSGICVDHDAPLELLPRLQAVIIHWLGLEQDTTGAYQALSEMSGFRSLAAAFPHLRLISYPDLFEALATTVIGQQVSLAAARTLAGRYVEHLGEAHPSGLRAFPTAESTASLNPTEIQAIIRCPLSRAATLHNVASWYLDDGQELGQRPDEFLGQLLSLRGVGPWTRDYMALRGLRDPMIFLDSDLVVRRALKDLGMAPGTSASLPEGSGYLATLLLWAHDSAYRGK